MTNREGRRRVNGSAQARLPPLEAPTQPVPEPPRFRMTLTPRTDGEVDIDLEVNTKDVHNHQLTHVLLRAALVFSARPGDRIPSLEERQQAAVAQRVLEAHPAVQLFVRPGENLCLGTHAYETFRDRLIARDWIDAGPVPGAGTRPCEWAVDPVRFDAVYLADQ